MIDASPRPPIEGGPPPEFGGVASRWSPEHLLMSSIGLCLYTTFEVFAAQEKLEIINWHDSVVGVLEKTATGLTFTSYTIEVELVVDADDRERAATIFERAKRHCIVSNALRTPPTATARIVSPED